ncbi:unnamed protein product [Ambrosiozyma monospora]|uniref:Unnamed protein product n=1 Tax=Ambrosiozyma monospora TaxID=43982 RepID=A0ACB5TN21_AMBMO|nr:unnamed protein product [Ambrosiozyma monospora]
MVWLNGLDMGDGYSNVTIATGAARVFLDTGSAMSHFPSDILEAIVDQIGASSAKHDLNSTIYITECSSLKDQTFTFDFMGYKMTIPVSGFVVEQNGSNCTLGFGDPVDLDSDWNLGQPFLNNAYVVFDLDNNEVALALRNTESTDEDIEVITDSVPSATQAPDYSSDYNQLSTWGLTLATESRNGVKSSGDDATATSLGFT